MKKAAYVYQIIVAGTVRYIGKGTGYRINDHLRRAQKINDARSEGIKLKATPFQKRLAAAIRNGAQVYASKIVENLSSLEAFETEKRTIASFEPGHLWNSTAGGDGFSSEDVKAQWASPEGRQKKLRALSSPECSKKHSEANKKRWASAQAREKQAAKLKEYLSDPKWKENWSRANKERWNDPKQKEKRAEISSEIWKNPVALRLIGAHQRRCGLTLKKEMPLLRI